MNQSTKLVLLALFVLWGCQSREEEAPPTSQGPPEESSSSTPQAKPSEPPVLSPAALRRLSPEQSHQRMAATLKSIDNKLRIENPYLGDRELRDTQNELDALPPDAAKSKKFELLLQLGTAALRLGREQEAVDALNQARQLLDQPDVRALVGREGMIELAFQQGVASMRMAETANCCQRNSADSCILPIRGQGIHLIREPARNAIGYFTEALEKSVTRRNPTGTSRTAFRARWLLNIAYMTVGEYPDEVPPEYLIPENIFQPEKEFPCFTNIAKSLGLDTFSLSGGAVADDFDGDNLLDLFVSTWDPAEPLSYFHNNGDGTFEDLSNQIGLDGIGGGLNLLQADYNNDGWVDVLVLRGAWFADAGMQPNSLLRNNGDGTFTDVTFIAGLGDVHYPTQTASWADFDNDGHLDLYVGNEQGKGVTAPCQLFHNQGDGTFEDIAVAAGVTNDRFTKAVIWGDYDNDRWPDLYVSNLGDENRLYRNQGDGTFRDVGPELAVTEPLGSFPAWFFDANNDGLLDLYVASYTNQIEHLAAWYLNEATDLDLARLYLGTGDGQFQEVAQEWNLTRPTLPMGSNFGDLNGDGYLDFYLGTGDPAYYNLMPNVMSLNENGERFVDVTIAGGFGHLQKGHAVVFADLDHDGDQDVFEQVGGAFPGDKFFDALYENPGFEHRWLSVHLIGEQTNRSAIGARIAVTVTEDGVSRTIYKHVNSGGSFGCNPLRQNIGLGDAERIEQVEIYWPTSDQTQIIENVSLDSAIRITEGDAEFEFVELPAFDFAVNRES